MEYRPSIGITTHGRNEKGRFDLNVKYVESVRRAGGYPVLLPPGETNPEECLEFLDGIILSGGADVDPALYRGKQHPEVYGVDKARDACEIALVKAIFERKTPTLCICRGMQILNVALGGSLIEHLPDEIGPEIAHKDGDKFQTHAVDITPASRLARIVDAEHISTASMHHQALRKLAPGLTVVAQSKDGVIEAVEHADHEDLIAVQWHPEHTAAEDERQQALFNWLVETLAR
ncbi:MAG: gamma-glutamyl-gamma-aminobutyrate hydrolase family protein [Planctomycetes bacterium]|nr:gamma-glutamyl-gamma-aminobutyrate hydrolase family protein [Planctomycetota bacterium]